MDNTTNTHGGSPYQGRSLSRLVSAASLALTAFAAVVILATPARSQPIGHKLKELVAKPLEKPKLAAGAAAAVSTLQRDALMSAVKSTGVPLASRKVLAMSGNEVVRLTDANAAQILSKPTLTAERVSTAIVETSASGVLTSLGATRAFVLPTRFTTLPPQRQSAGSFRH